MKSPKPSAISSVELPQRPQLAPASEQTRRWSTLLETELLSWPGVIAKPMFGFRGLYRGKKIFAALPGSRGFGPEASVLLKFESMPPALAQRAGNDARLTRGTPGNGWCSFTLDSDADLRDALVWLNHSYDSASRGKSR